MPLRTLGSPSTEPATSTHYQRLGVAASASTEEIRSAYRTLAGRLHPDRTGGASPAERALADRRMREINEAWHVLRDPARRRAYDESRLGSRHSASGAGRDRSVGAAVEHEPPTSVDDDDLVEVMPPMGAVTAGLFRHLPWVALLVVFGLIFVLTAYATGDDPTPDPAPRVGAGSCVDVEAGPVTTVVSCDGPHDLQIVRQVREAAACPVDSEARRLGDDAVVDCVVEG